MATLGAQKKHKVTIVGSGNWYALYAPSPEKLQTQLN